MPFNIEDVQKQASVSATADVQRQRLRNDQQAYKKEAERTAIGKLLADLKSFNGSIKDVSAVAAKHSVDGIATTSLRPDALPGEYAVFVEQVATKFSMAVTLNSGNVESTGTLAFNQNGKNFTIDLAAIDRNKDGKNSLEELASAINAAADNSGVIAKTARAGGEMVLLLESSKTGVSSGFSLSSGTPGVMADALVDAHLTNAKNAKIRVGGEQGAPVEQASNTFEALFPGVQLSIEKAQQAGDTPLTIDVGPQRMSAKENIDNFLSKVNELFANIKVLTSTVSVSRPGPLASDFTARQIESQLKSVINAEYGGKALASFGIMSDRIDGFKVKYPEGIAADTAGFEKLMSGDGNLLSSLGKILDSYSDQSNGPLTPRVGQLDNTLNALTKEREAIEARYDTQYKMYLKKYSDMAARIQSIEGTITLINSRGSVFQ